MIELNQNEKVLFLVRKHWLVFFFESGGALLVSLLVVLALPFAGEFFPDIALYLGSNSGPAMVFFGCAWLLLVCMGFFLNLTNYYLDILIVTDWRIIDIEQRGLFSRSVTNTPLQNIEDVKVEIHGILPTLFRFGNLHVQSAAEHKEIVMYGARRPEWVRDRIIEAHAKVAQPGAQT